MKRLDVAKLGADMGLTQQGSLISVDEELWLIMNKGRQYLFLGQVTLDTNE
jgi:hypothetical protein